MNVREDEAASTGRGREGGSWRPSFALKASQRTVEELQIKAWVYSEIICQCVSTDWSTGDFTDQPFPSPRNFSSFKLVFNFLSLEFFGKLLGVDSFTHKSGTKV